MEAYEYKLRMNPKRLFNDTFEVIAFCSLSKSVEELKAFLKECEDEELYEYCRIIQNRIDAIECNNRDNNRPVGVSLV